jgi:hypothetical protein
MTNLFRCIVLANFILYVIYFNFPFLWQYVYDAKTLEFLYWGGFGAKFNRENLTLIAYTFLLLISINTVGLLYFKHWARSMFVLLILVSIGFSLILGISLEGVYDKFLSMCISMLDGMIMVFIYLTRISKEFNES